MINLNDFNIFKNNKSTLKELSVDDHDKENIEWMTSSELEAIDYDEVKRIYVNELGISEDNASSVDAISCSDDRLCFVEFKNGKVENRNIKDKIRDSLLMFCDIVHIDISYTREKAEFILVYNENKHPLPNQYTKGCASNSLSRTFISKRIAQLGKGEIVLFGLERYKKLFFKEVHTYTIEEFEDYVLNLKEIN